MPTYPHIEAYYTKLEDLKQYGGSDNELSIRRAFENCLDAYCHDRKDRLVLVAELRADAGLKTYPDGTVRDSLRMDRGYWEAKDTQDDLDTEIKRKLNRGYPRDNIIFENSETAVLIRLGTEAMRVNMKKPADLHRLISTFLDYVLPEVEKFREAWEQFKRELPTVLTNLRAVVTTAEQENPEYQFAISNFLAQCHKTIGPSVSEADVREMLLQHILTKDIFYSVFKEDQFHRENNIARQLDALEGTFFTGNVRREAIDRLRSSYGVIGRAADNISDYREKQQFLKAIYEDFYKAYNPAAADRLGVVYTPNEVVDFIIRGTDHLLRKHFGRSLADEKVQILDPATGTGTFITNLIDYLPPDRLEYKYLNEIHANEVAILPYYIANLNIEYSYKERTRKYLEFPNLCFVDTLDNLGWKGATEGAVQRQSGMNLGGLSEDNWLRVQGQNEKSISVIIGNPPYNANQQNENDNNRNREYPDIDRRISETYIAGSTAQKTKQYDMYKRFIRWASDRLDDDGIIAFITNRAYLDTRQDDGFRKLAAEEFTDIYVLDLGSDVRRNPKISGTTHNVFGIQTGVAIGFLVRKKDRLGQCGIHYAVREDAELAKDKLAYLREAAISGIDFKDITPDKRNEWLNQSNSDFDSLLPLANRETKLAKRVEDERAVFGLYSLGIATNRDEWTFDFKRQSLAKKVKFFCDTYRKELRRFNVEKPATSQISDWVDRSIKWTAELEAHLAKGNKVAYDSRHITPALYRPYTSSRCYYSPIVTHRRYQQPSIFPHRSNTGNRIICFSGTGSNKPFQALASDKLVSLDFLEKTQCLPFFRYRVDGKQTCNITDWGIRQFNDHYRKEWGRSFRRRVGKEGITAEDIFAYTYAVLHNPSYREAYCMDLLREFPRLPFYDDFEIWKQMGQELLELHIGFETAKPYNLKRVDLNGAPRRVILRANKDKGQIVLDDKTSLTDVPPDAWEYQLGNRSALEWVLDQYKERKPRDPTIAEKFNTYRFADYKEQVIDLLKRVCTVSVKTVEIVERMSAMDQRATPVPDRPG